MHAAHALVPSHPRVAVLHHRADEVGHVGVIVDGDLVPADGCKQVPERVGADVVEADLVDGRAVALLQRCVKVCVCVCVCVRERDLMRCVYLCV